MSEQSRTDTKLLEVAIDHFGRRGMDGASTRAIAADAGTLMSSITYHFGGKQGLYLAAAEHIAASMRGWMAPAIMQAAAVCGADGDATAARAALHIIMNRAVELLTGLETEALSRFIVREQMDPTEAFDRIYAGVMDGMIGQMSGLLVRVSHGRLSDKEARLRAISLIGQVLVFRVARATVLAANQWPAIAEEQTAMIKQVIAHNLDAIFDRLSGDRP
jgi:AcrR family transcriptional regulator